MNHLWARHFGEPLVKDVTDFDRKNAPPQLPALLDWRAVEFIESRWSFKHLHRLMLNSSAYRLSGSLASVAPAARAAVRTVTSGSVSSVRNGREKLGGDVGKQVGVPALGGSAFGVWSSESRVYAVP